MESEVMNRNSRKISIKATVNGKKVEDSVEPRMLLVHFLRERMGLTGTHVGCDTSNCGACTVIYNGKSVKSCTMLAVQADDSVIETIESLEHEGHLHKVQEAFRENHGLQCGFCTPGMIMEIAWFLKENPHPTEDQIRWGISGNLCRCTGYQNIVEATKAAAENRGGD